MTIKRLTNDELLKEYETEISAIVGEQVGVRISEMATKDRELAEQKEEFKDKKIALETKVSEMTTKVGGLETENADLKKQLAEERDARLTAELQVYADEHISEMKKLDGANEKLIDLAVLEITLAVVDGDLGKSKTAYKNAFTGSLEKLVKIAEMFGGGDGGNGGNPPASTKKHSTNTGKKGDSALNRILNPELLEARNKRVGAAS